MKYKIIGIYQGNKEIIDSFTSYKEALSMLYEYKTAFSKDWVIYLEYKIKPSKAVII